MREAILEENAMFLAISEILMSSTMDEDEEDTTPIPRPMHISRHTGHVWVHKVLHGHERRCYNMFRMHPSIFLKLRDILVERELIRDSRYVTTSEQLAMFLYAMGHGVATGAMCEHFQHSSETISYYVNRVIKAIALLRFTYIVLPSETDPVHPRIRHDDREHGEDYYFNLRQMDNVEEDDDTPDNPNLVVTPPEMQAGEILRTQIATQIWGCIGVQSGDKN
ncbi:hypothetical protein Taro_002710 [Colocasia esculenta]|uniref:DUF8040 domain-containing protein n=1 Tax=Colocasia esculenta TaxID=4460 RepID=A0A843THA3_COLES|nr:hypothetical protein [Colocasia esculenta]